MPNIAAVLKQEISRIARKEIREQTGALRKASTQYRKDIAELKRRISDLQRKAGFLEKQVSKDLPARVPEAGAENIRFTAKGLRSQRERTGLSAADFGKLVGVSSQTIYNWEHGQSRPRKAQLARIAALRGLGKREAQARLELVAD